MVTANLNDLIINNSNNNSDVHFSKQTQPYHNFLQIS